MVFNTRSAPVKFAKQNISLYLLSIRVLEGTVRYLWLRGWGGGGGGGGETFRSMKKRGVVFLNKVEMRANEGVNF